MTACFPTAPQGVVSAPVHRLARCSWWLLPGPRVLEPHAWTAAPAPTLGSRRLLDTLVLPMQAALVLPGTQFHACHSPGDPELLSQGTPLGQGPVCSDLSLLVAWGHLRCPSLSRGIPPSRRALVYPGDLHLPLYWYKPLHRIFHKSSSGNVKGSVSGKGILKQDFV